MDFRGELHSGLELAAFRYLRSLSSLQGVSLKRFVQILRSAEFISNKESVLRKLFRVTGPRTAAHGRPAVGIQKWESRGMSCL